jgi:hypothetical protein
LTMQIVQELQNALVQKTLPALLTQNISVWIQEESVILKVALSLLNLAENLKTQARREFGLY